MQAVSAPANTAVQGMPSTVIGGAQQNQAMDSFGVFAALLGQMMGGEEAVQEGGFLSILAQMNKNSEKESTDLALQMVAELFAGNYGVVDLQSLQAMLQQPGQFQALPGAAQQLMQNVALLGQPQQQPAGQAQPIELEVQLPQPQQAMPQKEAEMMSAETGKLIGGEENGSKMLNGQFDFLKSVSEAKEQLANSLSGQKEEAKANAATVDVDQLQQDVNAGRFLSATRIQEGKQQVTTESLLSQLKEGIQHNLGLGKNEFVIKLKPEGLGELTVKMVENSGKITLSILASDAQVAKMLNSGLADLRDSLRPLNAEVHEVVEQTNLFLQNENMQQSYSEHARHQFQAQANSQHATYFYDDTAEELFEEPVIQVLHTTGLNTYI